MTVRLNCYRLTLDRTDGTGADEYVQYAVEIRGAVAEFRSDPATGRRKEPWELVGIVPRRGKPLDVERGGGPLSRRILMKVLEEEREKDSTFFFAFDSGSIGGSSTAYAPHRLFTESPSPSGEVARDEEGRSPERVYGPEDEMGHKAPKGTGGVCKIFNVKVRKDCEEDDPMADWGDKNAAWFQVRFTEVGTIPKSFADRIEEMKYANRMRQLIDAVLKSAQLLVGMTALGRSPRVFHFGERVQNNMRSRTVRNILGDGRMTKALYVGMTQAARLAESGGVYSIADSAIDWVDRETTSDDRPIPILDADRGTIAGVRVGDLSRPIADDRTLRHVEAAVKKLVFHVRYRAKIPSFLEKLKAEGKTDSEIIRITTKTRRNRTLKIDPITSRAIIGEANNPDAYSFESDWAPKNARGEGGGEIQDSDERTKKRYTVAGWFKARWGIDLRFPSMPIVCVGTERRREWYPIEFLYQAFGRTRAADSDLQKNAVLGYYDEHAGNRYVDNVTDLYGICESLSLKRLGVSFSDVLKTFNLQRKSEPLQLKAEVLPEPTLKLCDDAALNITNGSFSLGAKVFAKPADMSSFAIVDTVSGRGGVTGIGEMLGNLFRGMNIHGVRMPAQIDCMDVAKEITVTTNGEPSSPQQMIDAVADCIERARKFFLHDFSHYFRNHKVWHQTQAVHGGSLCKCLIIPLSSHETKKVGAIFPREVVGATHKIQNRDTGERVDARIMVAVRETREPVDPFDFRYEPKLRAHQALLEGAWVNVTFEKFVYQLESEFSVDEDEVVANPDLITILDEREVECPALMVAYLPDNPSELYRVVKLSHFFFQTPSQCVVATKVTAQLRKGGGKQYWSNLALKINTKMMSSLNESRAWRTAFRLGELGELEEGVPWVGEEATMVVGIKILHGLGQEGISVIGASVCLDPGCMQMAHVVKVQSKSEFIAGSILKDIATTLAIHFFQHNKIIPKRLLFYRDAVSEGSFERIMKHERACIRKAFYDLNCQDKDFECRNALHCKGKGCVICTPLITYVVCQTQHNIRVVPTEPCFQLKNNVFSGTCVDHTITADFKQLDVSDDTKPPKPSKLGLQVFSEEDENNFDFLLTAQGGLKGTSKPIYYRVLLNENFLYTKSSECTRLTKKKLQLCTYHMSFQYGTATKAVRSVPVVYFSCRLAKQFMDGVHYLRGTKINLAHDTDGNFGLVNIKVDDDEDDTFTPTERASGPEHKFICVRQELQKVDSPSEIRTELLPGFSPFQVNGTNEWRSPFRPHLSA